MASIKCCKNCKDRYRITDTPFIEDCHDHCDKYKAERKIIDDLAEKKKNEYLASTFHMKKVRNRNDDRYSKLGVYGKRSD